MQGAIAALNRVQHIPFGTWPTSDKRVRSKRTGSHPPAKALVLAQRNLRREAGFLLQLTPVALIPFMTSCALRAKQQKQVLGSHLRRSSQAVVRRVRHLVTAKCHPQDALAIQRQRALRNSRRRRQR